MTPERTVTMFPLSLLNPGESFLCPNGVKGRLSASQPRGTDGRWAFPNHLAVWIYLGTKRPKRILLVCDAPVQAISPDHEQELLRRAIERGVSQC